MDASPPTGMKIIRLRILLSTREMNQACTCWKDRLVRPDFRNESLLTDTTKYDDTRNPEELSSTTVSGLAPLKDQVFYLPSTEGRILLIEIH